MPKNFAQAMEHIRLHDMPKTLWHLYAIVRVVQDGETWRMGQALFNVLSELRPDISKAIRATTNDPFHVGGPEYWKDPRWERAVLFIEAHWGKQA